MGNKRLVFAIILVIALIALVIAGYLYTQNSSKQAKILQQEIALVTQTNILKDDVDANIKTTGKYAIIEETVKGYLKEVRNTYLQIKNYCNDKDVSSILSGENIEKDSKELSIVKEKIEEYEKELEKLKDNANNITDEYVILKKIDSKNLKDYYNDIYKNIMLNETMKSNLLIVKQEIKSELDIAKEKKEALEKVVQFLEDNKTYWKISNGKIEFNNLNKLSEYYQLLNDIG